MKIVFALVDYDNAIEEWENTQADVGLNLSVLCSRLSARLSALIPGSENLTVRLYGGWNTAGNQPTRRADWLLAELPNYRKRFGPLRVRPSIVTELIIRSDLTFIGTYQNQEQKMVDGMLMVDALELATDANIAVAVVSDDDDFVPAIISGAERRKSTNPIYLLRRVKTPGAALNDGLLTRCNVRLASY